MAPVTGASVAGRGGAGRTRLRHVLRLFTFIAIALLWAPAAVLAQQAIPELTAPVNDFANVIGKFSKEGESS